MRLALSIRDSRSLLEVLLLLPPADRRILHCRKSAAVAGRRVLSHVRQFLGRMPRVRVALSHVGAPREAAAGAPCQCAGAVGPAALCLGCSDKKRLNCGFVAYEFDSFMACEKRSQLNLSYILSTAIGP